jgi:hypothetical protein
MRNVESVDTIGPVDIELGTDASPDGPYKTVAANRTGATRAAATTPVIFLRRWKHRRKFMVGLQTARALGLEVPNSLQLLADEVKHWEVSTPWMARARSTPRRAACWRRLS